MIKDLSIFPFDLQIPNDEYLYCSKEGIQKILSKFDSKKPLQNIFWSTELDIEIPIRMSKTGPGSMVPITLIDQFKETVRKWPNRPAISVKRNGKWSTINYKQQYDMAINFGNALMALKVEKYHSINIIGFNSPEWIISYFGAIFAEVLPVGIYTTNQPEACHYICEHSKCDVVVVENVIQLNKYLQIWHRLPYIKCIVIYNDKMPDNIPQNRKSQIMLWQDFLQLGQNYHPKNEKESLENRMNEINPGNCCSIIYTSGTTGPPKGVIISHDNYTYQARAFPLVMKFDTKGEIRTLSYLPLSHIAGQILDIIITQGLGGHVYCADPSIMSGSLLNYLKDVRPTWFFGVPRIWEKLYEFLLQQQTLPLNNEIGNWLLSIGIQGTYAEENNKILPDRWQEAKAYYNKIKEMIGLDQAASLSTGAAPIQLKTRKFLLQLNLNMQQIFGMSEMGAQNCSVSSNFKQYDDYYLRSCGVPQPGSIQKNYQPDSMGNGEACFRGRNRFTGYLKNIQETANSIDNEGFFHSGDQAKFDEFGNMEITGRFKELLITAGGENVPPVLVEDIVKQELSIISNCMLIGDQKKYLSLLICLKHDMNPDGSFKKQLSQSVIDQFKAIGSTVMTAEEARKCEKVRKFIQDGIIRSNAKATSRAQYIQKWVILDGDFSVAGKEFTPTMKLQRKVTANKYKAQIDSIYIEEKL